jgi:hypothetical protein
MAKKVTHTFKADIVFNNMPGGAWHSIFGVIDEEGVERVAYTQAWRTATAAKRYMKLMAQEFTPRKTIKMIPTGLLDAKGRPAAFEGKIEFKVDKVDKE